MGKTIAYQKACLHHQQEAETRQAMYVQPKIETRSCNNRFSRKTMSITCCECMFVAVGIEHATCCLLWPVWGKYA